MAYRRPIKQTAYLAAARYFMLWAGLSLRRWKPRVIAVTGSVGKTTMLHLIEAALGKSAHYSHNANSAFGIAFDVVGLRGVTGSRWRWLWLLVAVPVRSIFYRHRQDYYVVEIDGERPDEAGMIADWLRPEITLWISLANSHATYFDRQVASGEFGTVEEAITHEFAKIPLATSSTVLIDADNQSMVDSLTNCTATIEPISSQPDHYQVSPRQTSYTIDSQTYTLPYPVPVELSLQLRMLSRLVALIGRSSDIDLSGMTMPPGRNSWFEGVHNTTLIDSSYNAHLVSMISTLDMMRSMKLDDLWLVLGDMIEQGNSEQAQHEQLAEYLSNMPARKIVLVGRRMKKYVAPILDSSRHDDVVAFDDPQSTLDFIVDNLTGDEVICFKGSQYLEWLVEKLLANPDDISRLPRQEPAARARRAARGLI